MSANHSNAGINNPANFIIVKISPPLHNCMSVCSFYYHIYITDKIKIKNILII